MEDKLQNSISTKQLYREFDWYQQTFPQLVQNACEEFFDKNFRIELLGISKNINCLIDNESCFVTKIKINNDYDIFFRLTDKAINLILTKVLGQAKNKFNINKISELEAKVITSFNDFVFEALNSCLKKPDSTQIRRTNFDVIHLTFIIKDIDDYNKIVGKFIITLPQDLIEAQQIVSNGAPFSEDLFPYSTTYAKVLVGKTKFSLYDLKNLEEDDVVVFENSNIEHLKLTIYDETLEVKISPNMDLMLPQDNDGGEDMGESHQNIWDSIEVEMSAEFDAVKITLGELKDIENGLVVDLTSIYDNNVTLKVEGKPIASGSLVIVNDRYGVKINNVIAQGDVPQRSKQQSVENEGVEDVQSQPIDNQLPSAGDEGDEEFDYSDFELEDDNI
ncbi:MAG: FliM/FliN family flagellar motor switch protein [Cyanobacteria bacterium SIG26]|nr:FliM/FliN family flagellar motor switch protein [Cyanobacteria bacterium SIG26]